MKAKYFIRTLPLFYLIGYFAVLPVGWGQDSFGQPLGSPANSQQRDVKSFGNPSEERTTGPNLMQLPQNRLAPTVSGVPVFYIVHVLGEVGRPGTYKIIPSDRVTDALSYAGDVLPNGSERVIQLRRDGSTKILDLFSYKYKGNLNQNPYLMDNDVLLVPVKKGEIEVEGPVNRPGRYEITKNITLKDAISMAGGFTAGLSRREPVRVVRYNGEEKREVIEVENSMNDAGHFTVQKGDVIVVPHILIADKEFDYNLKRIPGDNIFYPTLDDNIYVIGAVTLPGAYEFKPNYSYKEYVNLAGPTRDAKMKSIKVVRSDGKKLRVKRSTNINPGDTLVVPQRYWKPETLASWLGTLSSLTLSTLLISDRF